MNTEYSKNLALESLYFIAVVPPEDVRTKVTELKELCHQEYGSKQALKSPPHITLHMPFKLKEKKKEELCEMLTALAHDSECFNIEMKGFGFFEPRVVFISTMLCESLNSLHLRISDGMRKHFNIFNAQYKDRAFHPHMTIAFRDLKKEQFWKAQEFFSKKELSINFQVENMALLKHNGKVWEIEEQFSLLI